MKVDVAIFCSHPGRDPGSMTPAPVSIFLRFVLLAAMST